MWQQARAKTSNTDARLLIIVDAPNSSSWVSKLISVPPAAAFASGVAVQASCGPAGSETWADGNGGSFTSWYVSQETHGQSPWTVGGDEESLGQRAALPREKQVPTMATKWDVLTQRRDIMCVGGEDGVPNLSLYNAGWFSIGGHGGHRRGEGALDGEAEI